MAKEIILYSGLYSYTAETVVRDMGRLEDDEDITVRLNSPGGDVNAGFAIISRMSELTGRKNVVVDGQASSMAAFMLVFFDHGTANDTSSLMFHKAAYNSWYEPTEAEKKELKIMNAKFEEQMRKRVDGKPGAEELLAELFEADARNNVNITPQKAKALGIIDEVRTLEPRAYSGMQLVAMHDEGEDIIIKEAKIVTKPKIESMTPEELLAKHPATHATILALGVSQGVTAQKDISEAWALYAEIDPKATAEGIASGVAPSIKVMAEMGLKASAQAAATAAAGDNAPGVETPPAGNGKTPEELKAEKDKAILAEELNKSGLTPKTE